MKTGDFIFGVVIAIFMIPYFILSIFRKKNPDNKPEENHALKVYSLSSGYFLLNLLYFAGFVGFIIALRNLNYNIWLKVIISMLVWILLSHFCPKPLKRVKKLAYEESENQQIVKIKKISIGFFIGSVIVTMIFSKHITLWFGDGFLYFIWFGTYVIIFNTLGWYFFRKNEKAVVKQSIDDIE